jgi:hypothetical protein
MDKKTKKTTKCPSKNNNENGSNYEAFTIEKKIKINNISYTNLGSTTNKKLIG